MKNEVIIYRKNKNGRKQDESRLLGLGIKSSSVVRIVTTRNED